ncbi:hypothetical protein MPTK1_4g22970 [Marchantia polymorpha subsp. ruderalis]|uniref:EF-hand domain-containing protein n=2 Tax=Marchantia polymorpha TaxID=3197 RepID=A0AAF6BCT6_MARPO|nr:hypothetical protein MARPO_0020s0059 [Marchantia polymorpha]BBN09820.1 hypothetical protein Mp_4g22970 [Marchantia polymorpha subsp. ruderalis]|eukprot:PTQ44395.1 hypothetical protein MARPO_0020s0059 [Marchantia polymorpha]
MARKDSNPQRRWSLSTPTSPLSREDSQVGYPGASSRLAPYHHPHSHAHPHPHPGSFYSASPTLRPVACRKIRNDISAEEKQEICMAFELFDSRKIGKHNLRDLKVAMRALDFPVKKADCRKLMEKYCKDGSDEVDKDEFMEILTAKYQEKDPDEDLAKAFRFFDEDNTGKISLKNLRKIARDLGEHITDDELAAMIDEFDKDGDGEISETEFLGIMKRDDADS